MGHTSTNKKGYSTRYYCCGNKYRTHSCGEKNINADDIETFVVLSLNAYLLTADFTVTAQAIADQVNSASPDLSAERAELAQVSAQIKNGVRAVMSGMDIPELKEELDRLRIRKSELEDIIQQRSSEHPEVDPAAIVKLLQDSVDNWDDAALPQIVRQHVTKIYAHADGSYTVNVGVHLSGCGGRT